MLGKHPERPAEEPAAPLCGLTRAFAIANDGTQRDVVARSECEIE